MAPVRLCLMSHRRIALARMYSTVPNRAVFLWARIFYRPVMSSFSRADEEAFAVANDTPLLDKWNWIHTQSKPRMIADARRTSRRCRIQVVSTWKRSSPVDQAQAQPLQFLCRRPPSPSTTCASRGVAVARLPPERCEARSPASL